MRKGAATYCSSGSTAGPPGVSISLRAGWSLPGVQNTYLRYQSAGDHYVGRMVCGLPVNNAEFALLPPHFEVLDDEIISMVNTCFPNLPRNLFPVALHGLASLLFHVAYLIQNMPNDHLLFSTAIFTDLDKMQALRERVRCGFASPSSSMQPTGIPNHTTYILNERTRDDAVAKLLPAITVMSDQIINGVINVLEERAIGAGTVTRDGLEEMIDRCIGKTGILELVAQQNGGSEVTSRAQQVSLQPVSYEPFFWGGRYHRLPQDFTFPKAGLLVAWQIWCCGNALKRYVPLRRIDSKDLANRNLAKRLSDFRFVMVHLESLAKTANCYVDNPTVEQATVMFETIEEQILPPALSQNRHRVHQLKWRTYVNILRKNSILQ